MSTQFQCRQMLEAALFDGDSFTRLRKVIAGCKVLSSSLPFAQITDPWVGDEELYKYLMLSSPFALSSIELIIQALITNFQSSPAFLDAFWKALNYCSKLEEVQASTNVNQNSLKRISLRQETSYIENKIKNQFARDVYLEFEKVKVFAIELCEIFFEIYAFNKSPLDSRLEILKQFLLHSASESVTLKVMDTISNVRHKYSQQCRQLRYLEEEIDQSSHNSHMTVLIAKRVHAIENMSHLESSTLLRTGQEFEEKQPQIKVTAVAPVEEKSQEGSGASFSHSSSEESVMPVQNEISEVILEQSTDVRVQIEKWLLQKHIPQLKANEDSIEYFKNEGNFEILMTFVIDPTFYRISPKWKEAYPELINKERFRDVRGFKMSVHSQIREHGMGPDYVMRSHKVVSYITEKSNFTIIGHCNTQIVAKLFHIIYGFFQNQEFLGNLYHIAKLIHFLFQNGPRTALYHLVDYNLMFQLAQVLYNPYMFKIVLDVLNSVFDVYELGHTVLESFWSYIHESQYIRFLCKVMIKAPLEHSKQERSYKTKEILDILKELQHVAIQEGTKKHPIEDKLLLNELLGSLKPGRKPFEENDKPQGKHHLHDIYRIGDVSIQQHLQREHLWSDELTNKRVDIDGLLRFVKQRKKITHEIITSVQDSIQRSSRTPTPTLLEIHQVNHSANPNTSALGGLIQGGRMDVKKKQSVIMTADVMASNRLGRLNTVEKPKPPPSNKWISFDPQNTQVVNEYGMNYYTQNYTSQKKLSVFQQNLSQDVKLPSVSLSERNKTLNSEYIMQMKDDLQHSRPLHMIYPCVRANICTSELERKSKDSLYSDSNVEFQEMDAYACAHLAAILFERFTLYESNFDQYNQYKKMIVSTHNVFTTMLDEEMITFSIFFEHYLITLPILTRYESENSAIECGKLVNRVLENVFKISDLYQMKDKIIQKAYDSLDFCCKVILKLNGDTQTSIKLFKQSTPKLGTHKIILMDTLVHTLDLMVKDKKVDTYRKNPFLFLNESVLHVLLLWFFNYNKNNNIYQQRFSRLMNLIFAKAPEQIIMTLVFKLSLISSLGGSFQRIVLNDIPVLLFNIDPFLLFIKVITQIIRETSKNRQLPGLKQCLHTSASWKTLLAAINVNDGRQWPQIFKTIKDSFGQQTIKAPMQQKKLELPMEQPPKQSLRTLVINNKGSLQPIKLGRIASDNSNHISPIHSERGENTSSSMIQKQALLKNSKFTATTRNLNLGPVKLNKAEKFSDAVVVDKKEQLPRRQSQRKLVPQRKTD